MLAYSSVMIVIIPIGVPLLYFMVLFKRRTLIQNFDRKKPMPKSLEPVVRGNLDFYY